MVARYSKNLNRRTEKALQPFLEWPEGFKEAVFSVDKVAGERDCVDTLRNGVIYKAPPHISNSIPVLYRREACWSASEVKIAGAEYADGLHLRSASLYGWGSIRQKVLCRMSELGTRSADNAPGLLPCKR